MIKLLRIDHRLIHGQVAFAWTKFLETDCILIASDQLVQNELKMSAMRMAKPSGVKLVMKSIDDAANAINSGVSDKYKLFILCESIADAFELTNKTSAITQINLGGMKSTPQRKQIAKAVHVSDDDIEKLKEMNRKNIQLEIRLVPNDKMEDPMKLI